MDRPLAALIVALALLPAVARTAGGDPCATQANTIEINACLRQQFEAQDRLLNAAYQKLLRALGETGDGAAKGESPRDLLVAAQRRWIEFRDADCKAMRQLLAGGSGASATQLACLRDRTEQRIRQLDTKSWIGN